MKIKSIEKLQDLIDGDIVWRKKELFDLHALVYETQNPVYIRAGIALLSAHFEGFIKQTSNYYILYVSDQKIEVKDLSNNFIALQIKTKLNVCSNSEKTSVHTAFVDDFKNVLLSKFNISYSQDKPLIKTNGNPSSEVFEEIIKSVGLSFERFETKRNYIDADLLSNRHKIVHGEKINITLNEFDDTYRNILWIIEEFRTIVLNAAINKLYLVK